MSIDGITDTDNFAKRTKRQAFLANFAANKLSRTAVVFGVPTNKYIGPGSFNSLISGPVFAPTSNNAALKTYIPPVVGAPPASGPNLGSSKLFFGTPGVTPCTVCPNSATGGDSTLGILSVVLQSLDFVCLNFFYIFLKLSNNVNLKVFIF